MFCLKITLICGGQYWNKHEKYYQFKYTKTVNWRLIISFSATKPNDQPPTTSLTYSDVVKKDVSFPPTETENLQKIEIRKSVENSNSVVTASDDIVKAEVVGQSSSSLAAEQLTIRDSSSLREGSASPISTSCPLCRRQDWKQLEGDLWRLELWLDQATRILNQYLSQV